MTATHFLAGLILVGAAAALAIPDSISGPARVIDGDTIVISSQHIRLWGIDAPEHDQPQGPAATAFLKRSIGNEPVDCASKDRDKYGRIVAQCSTVAGDLGRRMVANGHAIDYTHYSHGYYRAEEQAARAEHLGIWAGPFVPPEQWRRAHKHY